MCVVVLYAVVVLYMHIEYMHTEKHAACADRKACFVHEVQVHHALLDADLLYYALYAVVVLYMHIEYMHIEKHAVCADTAYRRHAFYKKHAFCMQKAFIKSMPCACYLHTEGMLSVKIYKKHAFYRKHVLHAFYRKHAFCVLLYAYRQACCMCIRPGRQRPHRFSPQLDEFSSAEKTILENCICIVPKFING